MEASYIEKLWKNSGARPSTVNRSPGHLFEDFAIEIAKQKNYQLVARNFRWHRLEGDLLLWCAAQRRYYLWEVRGRSKAGFRPSLVLSPAKLRNLRRLTKKLQQQTTRLVRLQLIEVIGVPPDSHWKVYNIDG